MRVSKKFRIPLMFLLSLFFLSCTGSGSQNGFSEDGFPIGVTPTFLIETATEGTLRAELNVYGPDGELVHSEDLQINVETGEIFSSQFDLPRGFSYSFVITFYFSRPDLPELPVAFVAKVASTDEDFLNVFFDAAEVLTTLSQLNPAISASMSQSILPDLDADDDGFSNFAEVLEGSDPYDPNDIPAAPEMESIPVPDSRDDVVEFRVIFTDTSGVASIKPAGDFVCGYFEWEITPLDEKGRRTELHIKFNLYSQPSSLLNDGDTLQLKFKVTDNLGISATHTVSVENVGIAGTIPSSLNHPEFLILNPEQGQSVSDFFIVEAMACHRNGISEFFIENIDGFNDEDASQENIVGTISTGNLNANQPIDFVASAVGGFSNKKTVTVIVDDLNPIKIDSPTPGETLSDGFTIVAHVDKNAMPDITQFYVEKVTSDLEGNEDVFSLNQLKFDVNSLPEAFTGQVFDTSQVGVSKFYVHFVAIGPDTGRKERTVSYLLNNQPEILDFAIYRDGPLACIKGREIHLKWRVDNIGEDGEVYVEDKSVPNSLELIGDTKSVGFPHTISCAAQVKLEAIRYAEDLSGGPKIPISNEAFLNLDQIEVSAVNVDNFDRDLADPIFLVTLDPGSLISDVNNLSWEIEIVDNLTNTSNIKTTNQVPDMATLSGGDLGMHYWGDYTVTFRLLASGEVISSSQPFDVFYLHPALVGWWPLNGDGSAYVGFDAFDGNAGASNNSCGGISPLCLDFDGSSDYLVVGNYPAIDFSNGNAPAQSFSVEVWVNFADLSGERPILVKTGQFSLGLLSNELVFSVTDHMGADHSVARGLSGLASGWHHLVGVFPSSGKPELWVDGNKVSDNSTTSTDTIQNSFGNFYMGQEGTGSSFFDGALEEVKVYEQALSAGEIADGMDFYYEVLP